ncbi:Anion:Cation symporter family protein [Paxillus involutus ATCC 200175]|uniref:Anion:Cation symporter family protein n=1 Tax=Paxillus involutus ATCC 200175 TaxID=664439 RepID=A0A0C9TTJ6_PAXIN|nr:Anion:Cation symporter family protein [Paxillus involutus ATCC 200175]
MLLKFSKADILNSSLVYPDTGALGYTILTRSHFIRAGDKDSDTESEDEAVETRRTIIYNKNGISMAGIVWEGRRPVEITIGQEKINVKGMFGCQSAILSHNILGIPARFDTEFFWMAAPDGLTLLDYDSNEIKGQFHVNSLRVGERFITTPISGLGHDYLEFEPHPLASTDELIVTFLLMEILRRGRFNQHSDAFDRPKLWRSTSLANFRRRLRRGTI